MRIWYTGSKFFRIINFGLILLLFPALTASHAFPLSINEYRVKAAFIYNFTKFIDWPDKKDVMETDRFIIGIIGTDPFGREIEILKNKTLKGTPLEVRRYNKIENIRNCKILFISASFENRLDDILAYLEGYSVLTVGDAEGLAHKGVMINFFRVGNKIRFEINPAAARSSNVKISSHLLKLSKIVTPDK